MGGITLVSYVSMTPNLDVPSLSLIRCHGFFVNVPGLELVSPRTHINVICVYDMTEIQLQTVLNNIQSINLIICMEQLVNPWAINPFPNNKF